MNIGAALAISLVLLLANAFFVAAEFALVAAKRHRLQALADTGSKPAAAALAAGHELTVMLAGAQLGITVCTVGLGALAEPALARALTPVFTLIGLGETAAHVIGFVLGLVIVVFAHMVLAEMAPKSWAISHPERSAVWLAIPFRAFMRPLRPVLLALNAMANGLVRLAGVTPTPEIAQAHGPDEMRILLSESREAGYLPEPQHRVLSGALRLQSITVGDLMVPRDHMIAVRHTASATEIETASRLSGRSRLVVIDAGRPIGLVHIRDAVQAGPATRADRLMAEPLLLNRDARVSAAVTAMRRARAQLALVADDDGDVIGLVALEDLLEQIVGEFNDETDPGHAAPHQQ